MAGGGESVVSRYVREGKVSCGGEDLTRMGNREREGASCEGKGREGEGKGRGSLALALLYCIFGDALVMFYFRCSFEWNDGMIFYPWIF